MNNYDYRPPNLISRLDQLGLLCDECALIPGPADDFCEHYRPFVEFLDDSGFIKCVFATAWCTLWRQLGRGKINAIEIDISFHGAAGQCDSIIARGHWEREGYRNHAHPFVPRGPSHAEGFGDHYVLDAYSLAQVPVPPPPFGVSGLQLVRTSIGQTQDLWFRLCTLDHYMHPEP